MVTQFDLVTADQFISAVDSLEKQGMERLVIDLRDNPRRCGGCLCENGSLSFAGGSV